MQYNDTDSKPITLRIFSILAKSNQVMFSLSHPYAVAKALSHHWLGAALAGNEDP
jgi:hypothetical protein